MADRPAPARRGADFRGANRTLASYCAGGSSTRHRGASRAGRRWPTRRCRATAATSRTTLSPPWTTVESASSRSPSSTGSPTPSSRKGFGRAPSTGSARRSARRCRPPSGRTGSPATSPDTGAGSAQSATGRPVQRPRAGAHPRSRPRPTLVIHRPHAGPHRAARPRGVRAALERRHDDRLAAAPQCRVADRQVRRAGPPRVTHRSAHRSAAGRGGRGARAVAQSAGGVGQPAWRRVGQPTRPGVHDPDRRAGVDPQRLARLHAPAEGCRRAARVAQDPAATVATQLAQAGVHPHKAQTFLGHADMTTTMKRYAISRRRRPRGPRQPPPRPELS